MTTDLGAHAPSFRAGLALALFGVEGIGRGEGRKDDVGECQPSSSFGLEIEGREAQGVPRLVGDCHPARARHLLTAGRAVVAHHTPMVIRLKDRTAADSTVTGVEVGIDPGSKFTGIAVFTRADPAQTRSTNPEES